MRPSATVNSTSRPTSQPMQVLRGIAISPGIALGPVVVLDRRGLALPTRAIAAEAVSGELERLDRAWSPPARRPTATQSRSATGSGRNTPTSSRRTAG